MSSDAKGEIAQQRLQRRGRSQRDERGGHAGQQREQQQPVEDGMETQQQQQQQMEEYRSDQRQQWRRQSQQQQQQQQQQLRANPVATSALAANATGRRTAHRVHLVFADWLASELLKHTDLESGDICMFHYPAEYVPKMDADEMGRALELVAASSDDASSEEARERVTRIQFSWYQFEQFPREALGRTYPNLQHVDIRQNASLTCINSLVSQLPRLSSLNLSDCPNVRTLLPLATALPSLAIDPTDDSSLEAEQLEDRQNQPHPRPHPLARRRLCLRHLWVRGCDLSSMSHAEWSDVFDALAESSCPLERLTLSRNNMGYLHKNIGKLQGLTYLFVEDNHVRGGSGVVVDSVVGGRKRGGRFELPDELGELSNLRFASFCGNDLASLPRTMGRLKDSCDVCLHRNPNMTYPPPQCRVSVKAMRDFFHRERMSLLQGVAHFVPILERARKRANERLYRPGGRGYEMCRVRFEREARRTSVRLKCN